MFPLTEFITVIELYHKRKDIIHLNIHNKVSAIMLNAIMDNGHNGQQHVAEEKEEEACRQLEKQLKESTVMGCLRHVRKSLIYKQELKNVSLR